MKSKIDWLQTCTSSSVMRFWGVVLLLAKTTVPKNGSFIWNPTTDGWVECPSRVHINLFGFVWIRNCNLANAGQELDHCVSWISCGECVWMVDSCRGDSRISWSSDIVCSTSLRPRSVSQCGSSDVNVNVSRSAATRVAASLLPRLRRDVYIYLRAMRSPYRPGTRLCSRFRQFWTFCFEHWRLNVRLVVLYAIFFHSTANWFAVLALDSQ